MRRKDGNGVYFRYEEAEFDWREKEKNRAEINTNYRKYEGKRMAVHLSYGLDGKTYKYYFENRGFDEINIFIREEYGD